MGIVKGFAFALMFFVAVPVGAEKAADSTSLADLNTYDLMMLGNSFYEASNYTQSAEAYQEILNRGYASADLYYNLGNVYFKKKELGNAILNYERALRLNPTDEDIVFNLKYARATTVDDIQSSGTFWFKDLTHAYLKRFSVNGWAWLSLAFMIVTVLCWLVFLSNHFEGPGIVLVFVISLLLSLMTVLSAFGRKALDAQRYAVLLEQEVTVKSAPSAKGEDMFIIHEGTKMELLDIYQEWLKIRLENGNVGWLPETVVEEI